MQSVQGHAAVGGAQAATSPAAGSVVGGPVSPSLVSPAGQEGSGLATPSFEPAHFPLPPAATFYAEAFGWPISVEEGEVTVTCGHVLDVTTMPAGFGGEVNQLLRIHLLMAPIVEMRAFKGNEPAAWAFLSQPRRPTRSSDQLLKLSSCNVKHFGVGAKFPLPPSPTCNNDTLYWRVPPPFGALKVVLPQWESIAACTLKAKQRSVGQ
jgi:hypothetical protein